MVKDMDTVNKEKKRMHVIKRRNAGWAVITEGAARASKIYATQPEAVTNALKYRNKGSDVVIHREDGSIERWEKAI